MYILLSAYVVNSVCLTYLRCVQVDGGNRINNDVYDIMIRYPDSFKLAHGASSAELSARRLLKQYSVVEEQCPMKKGNGEKGGKFIFNKYLHFSFV